MYGDGIFPILYCLLSKHVQHKATMKILKHAHVAKYFIVGTILRNICAWYKYNNVISYFERLEFDIDDMFSIERYRP